MRTAGEARQRLIAQRAKSRSKVHHRLLDDFRHDAMTESDLVLQAFTEGWDDGYKAGFQQALAVVRETQNTALTALRTSILSNGVRA